jgi:integrase
MKLTARKVQTAKQGKYLDGNGVFLLVKESGAKSWVFRYQINKRRRDLGLGSYPDVSLQEARQKAIYLKRQIKDGFDPLLQRQKQLSITFKEAGKKLIEGKRLEWKNPKHAKQWGSTLESYVYPFIGDLDVKNIEVSDVVNVLNRIWQEKPETASRVRGRIEAILDYSSALKFRTGDNPARWKGNLDHILAKHNRVKAQQHYEALDYNKITELMELLSKREGVSARALEFTILTATRSGETRGARWEEIDFEKSLWIIPAIRMKAEKEHRIPLCDKAMSILEAMKETSTCEYIFESQTKKGCMLSDMTLTSVLKRMKYNDITVHGFRSTFRDWAGETTPFPREIIEHALAHQLKDPSEAAYARGTLLNKRKSLMNEWEKFIYNQ